MVASNIKFINIFGILSAYWYRINDILYYTKYPEVLNYQGVLYILSLEF